MQQFPWCPCTQGDQEQALKQVFVHCVLTSVTNSSSEQKYPSARQRMNGRPKYGVPIRWSITFPLQKKVLTEMVMWMDLGTLG